MILAFDTYYYENKAKTVCITFNDWHDSEIQKEYKEVLAGVEEYTPGEFYKRELPCILSLYKQIDVAKIDAIVIDGFVYLDDSEKFGLGGYLYEALRNQIPVIGVAKSNFATIEKHKRAVSRGESLRPLYVTAIGIDLDDAAAAIKSMHGENRIPQLLKKLDMLTRQSSDPNEFGRV
jgi:deoxyribonuclease V